MNNAISRQESRLTGCYYIHFQIITLHPRLQWCSLDCIIIPQTSTARQKTAHCKPLLPGNCCV